MLRVILQLQRLHVYNKSDRNKCICKLLKKLCFESNHKNSIDARKTDI